MKNSKGIVIFAYNSTFDYVKIANVCAALAKKFTGFPVTLITDEAGALQFNRDIIDTVVIQTPAAGTNRVFRTTHDGDTVHVYWKNSDRVNAYNLSPYHKTLLLDCDYLMFNNNLSRLFDTSVEFTCHKDVYDITGALSFARDTRLNMYSVPQLWATVVYFRKCGLSKSVFEMWDLVRENYEYYSRVYGFRPAPFRNDFALSIAYHAMSGYGLSQLIPYRLPSMSPMTDVVEFRPNGQLLYQYKQNGKLHTGRSENMDLHVMNKEIFTDDLVDRMLEYASEA